jgi:hypothetical protein
MVLVFFLPWRVTVGGVLLYIRLGPGAPAAAADPPLQGAVTVPVTAGSVRSSAAGCRGTAAVMEPVAHRSYRSTTRHNLSISPAGRGFAAGRPRAEYS